jgi:hypothetical protein
MPPPPTSKTSPPLSPGGTPPYLGSALTGSRPSCALELTHHDVACAALDRLRSRLAASVSEAAPPAAAVNDIDTDQPDHRDAGARAAWAAAPITPAQINAADGTLRAQLVKIAATEQAIRNLNGVPPAAIEQAATAAYFNYRDKHGCDDQHAAHYAYTDAVDGIDSSYEVAWNATTLAAPGASRRPGAPASIFHARATTATIRVQLINVAVRITRSARRSCLRLPIARPRAAAWQQLFTAAIGPPAKAGVTRPTRPRPASMQRKSRADRQVSNAAADLSQQKDQLLTRDRRAETRLRSRTRRITRRLQRRLSRTKTRTTIS